MLASFIVTGGNVEKAAHAKGYGAPVRHAAAKVVATVEGLPTICKDHPGWCKAAHGAMEFAGAMSDGIITAVGESIDEKHKD